MTTDWMPFETAPKDGTSILVCDENDTDKDIYTIHYDTIWSNGVWSVESYGVVIPFFKTEPKAGFRLTHWRNVPAHPADL